MKVKAVLLDLGDTLVTYSLPEHNIIAKVLNEHNINVKLVDVERAVKEVRKYFIEKANHFKNNMRGVYYRYSTLPKTFWIEYNKTILERLSINKYDGIVHKIIDEFYKTDNIKVYPDVEPVLKTLRKVGIKIALVSNASHFANKVIRETGLVKYFDAVAISYQVGYEKPNPKIFAEALKKIRIMPHHAVHVGDTYETDIVGARLAGVYPILLDRTGRYNNVDCMKINSLYELLNLLNPRLYNLVNKLENYI